MAPEESLYVVFSGITGEGPGFWYEEFWESLGCMLLLRKDRGGSTGAAMCAETTQYSGCKPVPFGSIMPLFVSICETNHHEVKRLLSNELSF
jgi:hypothetical protein